MNERIRESALKCGAWYQVYPPNKFLYDSTFNIEKFAELIVRECADIATINQYQAYTAGHYVLKHFGVK